ncbi:ATPase with chaperone activity [Ramlibacter sp. 2FC]|uniref:ATPase with chaperone activity n=1 Tax=Ramlibacter sp. 2FC TaxID=2502188 RepID=UPI0010F97DE6|nr:ATPase with chaperone activity [Ramlibacter sp. 2FC]
MSDEYPIEIPPSFMALFMAPGRLKPKAPRELVAGRYELCEDMAQMLTEFASNMLLSLGITEADVLSRCRQGLQGEGAVLSAAESDWVVCRLAELLNWPHPALDLPPGLVP